MSIHHIGLWLTDIQKERDDILKEAVKEEKKAIKADYLKKQRRVLLFGVMLHLGILLIVKYTPFFATNINTSRKKAKMYIEKYFEKYLLRNHRRR